MNEDLLIKRCTEGYEEAWEELYQKYYGLVKKIIYWNKWNFNKEEANELIQDVFIDLVKNLADFNRQSTFRTYLTRMIEYKCISYLRKINALKRGKDSLTISFDEPQTNDDTDTFHLEIADDKNNPLDCVIASEEKRKIRLAVSRLDRMCREIIRLRYQHDLSYKEISSQLNLPEGTVASRLKRCLTKMKDFLELEEA